MNRCPYCGQQIQDQAQFCLHCMRPLKEKKDITQKPNSRFGLWVIPVLAFVVVTICFVLFWHLREPQKGNKQIRASTAKIETTDERETTDEWETTGEALEQTQATAGDEEAEPTIPSTGDSGVETNPPIGELKPPCVHIYLPATCTKPSTCSLCGATTGAPAGHQYVPATCTAAKTCTVCGVTEGSPAAHSYTDATCILPSQCTKCGHVNGVAKGHSLDEYGCCSACDYNVWDVKTVSGGVEISGLNEKLSAGAYKIPASIGGLPVVGIGNSAFYNDRTMRSIQLPDTITYIGEKAFYRVTGLTSIVIPEKVTSIGVNAFWECANLSEVYIRSDEIYIHNYAFSDSSLRNCTLTIYAPETAINRTTASVYWDAVCVVWDG